MLTGVFIEKSCSTLIYYSQTLIFVPMYIYKRFNRDQKIKILSCTLILTVLSFIKH